ncbi:MAG: tetratricopeptide repeat protein [Planctomycetota bacterium]|jgi:tetratricopeptide (TPR) repeat protein
MGRLLEILGKAITIDIADVIWHWFEARKPYDSEQKQLQYEPLYQIAELSCQGKIEEAEKHLKFYLFENPQCERGHLAMAAIHISRNQLQEAIEELKLVYQRQPNNTVALYAIGHCYERTGFESKAIEFYQDCLKFKLYLQLPAQRLAAIYFKNQQLEKAISQYELLIKEYPSDISTLIMLGFLYMANDKNDEAIDAFNKAILTHPDNYQSSDMEIGLYIQDQQLHQALEVLDQRLQQEPESVETLVKYGDLLNLMSMPTEAVEKYEEAVRICPNFLEATIKLGTEYLQMNQEKEAAWQFNQAVEINDQIVDAYIGLSIAQKSVNKETEAMETLSLAVAIQPNSSILFAEVATLLIKTAMDSSYQLVKDDFNNEDLLYFVIEAHNQQIKSSQDPDLYYRLGMLLMSIKNFNKAVKCFQKAIEFNPTYSRARTKLAICYYEANKKQKALREIPSSTPCYDKDILELHYNTALLYCDKVKFASSLMNLQRSMEDNFASQDITANVAIILQNLGLLNRVTAMWENLEDLAKYICKGHKI